jgi:hypothetical protein
VFHVMDEGAADKGTGDVSDRADQSSPEL